MSEKIINIKPLGPLARLADMAMVPVMRWGAGKGVWNEAPQQTHWWNSQHLSKADVSRLVETPEKMLVFEGERVASKRDTAFLHMPRYGGWKNYVVLKPTSIVNRNEKWYVGWICHDTLRVSRIPVVGPVRVLIGPTRCFFFGISSTGLQIMISCVGDGVIGDGGEFSQVPLQTHC